MLVVQVAARAGPFMFRHPFRAAHFRKGPEWVSLTRAAAFAAVHDRAVEPWVFTFALGGWKCEFRREGSAMLAGVHALLKQQGGGPFNCSTPRARKASAEGCTVEEWLRDQGAVLRDMAQGGFMPHGFSAQGLLAGQLPGELAHKRRRASSHQPPARYGSSDTDTDQAASSSAAGASSKPAWQLRHGGVANQSKLPPRRLQAAAKADGATAQTKPPAASSSKPGGWQEAQTQFGKERAHPSPVSNATTESHPAESSTKEQEREAPQNVNAPNPARDKPQGVSTFANGAASGVPGVDEKHWPPAASEALALYRAAMGIEPWLEEVYRLAASAPSSAPSLACRRFGTSPLHRWPIMS